MYEDKCCQDGIPVARKCIYQTICNNEFNIVFQKPKKDRCDECEVRRTNRNVTEEDKNKYARHIQSKIETKQERDNDRSMVKSASNDTAVICFDMKHVIALPRANISSFIYAHKLNL